MVRDAESDLQRSPAHKTVLSRHDSDTHAFDLLHELATAHARGACHAQRKCGRADEKALQALVFERRQASQEPISAIANSGSVDGGLRL